MPRPDPDGTSTHAFWDQVGQLNEWPVAQAAYAYAMAGVPVFPVTAVIQVESGGWQCSCPTGLACDEPGKHPLIPWSAEATADPDRVRQWWSRWPTAGIGMPTGVGTGTAGGARSGLLVVDLDTRETSDPTTGEVVFWDGAQQLDAWAQEVLPEGSGGISAGLVARTGGGGRHLFWQDAGGARSVSGWLPCVDVRSDGGLVLLAPSMHVSGSRYAWEQQGAPQPMVPGLAAALRTARGGHTPGARARAGPATPGEGGEEWYRLAKQLGPRDGQRDDFFNAYAFELRRGGVERAEAEARMRACWEMAEQTPERPFTWEAAVRKLERVWVDVEPDPEHGIAWRPEAAPARPVLTVVRDGDSPTPPPPPPPPGEHRPPPANTDWSLQLTEHAAAIKYVELNADQHRYTAGMGWFAWNGLFWAPDPDGVLARSVGVQRMLDWYDWYCTLDAPGAGDEDERNRRRAFATNLRKGAVQRSVLDLARHRPEIRVDDVDAWDQDDWLLVVGNGVLDLRVGQLRGPDPANLCTMQAAVDFDPAAECPIWESHVRMLTARQDGSDDQEMYDYLQTWAGYILTGCTDQQKFLILYGRGNNGKSRFAEALVEMLGTYGHVGSSQLVRGTGKEHETIWADLVGKRMVFIDEVPAKGLDEERAKKVTGENRMTARKIRQDSITFRAHFKMVWTGNVLPKVKDASDGFWRRVISVPCDAAVDEERRITDFLAVLRPERSGILNWALAGLVRYLAQGGLGPVPLRVAFTLGDYRESEDQVGAWIGDVCAEQSKLEWQPNVVWFGLYTRWCLQQGERPAHTMRTLLDELRRRGWERDAVAKRVTGMSAEIGGGGVVKGHLGPSLVDPLPFELAWGRMG